MAVQRILTWHTGSNVFTNEDEYFAFIENFTEITSPLKSLRDQYMSEGKMIDFRREVGNNVISFIAVFNTIAEKEEYVNQTSTVGVTPWLESLGWTKVNDISNEV